MFILVTPVDTVSVTSNTSAWFRASPPCVLCSMHNKVSIQQTSFLCWMDSYDSDNTVSLSERLLLNLSENSIGANYNASKYSSGFSSEPQLQWSDHSDVLYDFTCDAYSFTETLSDSESDFRLKRSSINEPTQLQRLPTNSLTTRRHSQSLDSQAFSSLPSMVPANRRKKHKDSSRTKKSYVITSNNHPFLICVGSLSLFWQKLFSYFLRRFTQSSKRW